MPDIRLIRCATGTVLGTLMVALAAGSLAQAQSATSASSAPTRTVTHRAAAAQPKNLDLHAPPLNHVYPSKQLQYILAPEDSGDILEGGISVKGEKAVINVPGGPGNQFVAIPWAILHPTQAWRIFTPLTSN